MGLGSQKWGYIRIITGTILGGILGFYVMHRLEVSYKEKMNERLRQYEREMKKKAELNELEESILSLLNNGGVRRLKQSHKIKKSEEDYKSS